MRANLSIFILFMAFMQASGESHAQNITLNEKDASLESVFQSIKKQTSFFFIYNTQELADANVDIHVKNATIEETMKACLENLPFTFKIIKNNVLVKRSEVRKAEEFSISEITPSLIVQQKEVRGVVTDEKGEPLAGVSVMVKGTSIGTVTDTDGHYTISVSDEQGTLTFSYIGFATKEAPAKGNTINIALLEDVASLNEVVVVGYGTQEKVNITGAVSTITSKELSVVPTANVSTLLYGSLPGLIPLQRSGEPGSDNVSLSIRGFSNALVVVDGVVGRDFSRLDPSEIESISILKDAASAAVYGVSGGNGVVLVTTKRGKIGKPVVSYTMNYGLQSFANFPSVVNSAEYAILRNEAAINTRQSPVYSDAEIQKFRDGTDPNYPDFNYTEYMMHKYFPQLEQNISIRGGTDKIKYFFLLGQTSQASVWKGVNGGKLDYAKYNLRSNVDVKITNNLSMSVDFGARYEDRNNLINSSANMFSWYMYQTPISLPKTPDGKISSHAYGLTAYLDRDLTGYIKDQRNVFEGALSVNYKIPFVSGLNANVKAARDINFRDQKQWLKAYNTYQWDEAAQASTLVGSRGVNQLILDNWKSSALRIQSSLNYERTFAGVHNVKGILLYEVSEDQATNFEASRTGYVVPIDQIFAGPSLGKNNSGGASDNGRESYVGRVNYDYLGKYLLEYSFRYDGSAKFPPDRRWGYFSGVSAGWRISEESFIKDNFSDINNLKVRGSWGRLGSDNTGNFQYLTGYNYPSGSYILGGSVVTSGMLASGIPNPNITWEESQIYNLGVDLSISKGLLDVQADVFYRKRDGLLATRIAQLPSTFGATLPAENLNSDAARGFEIALGHTSNIGNVKVGISTNLSYTKIENRHLEQRTYTNQYDNWRNNRAYRYSNMGWAYKYLGQFQSIEEILSSPIQDQRQNSTLLPGDLKYEDFNGDGIIDANDMQPIIKTGLPELNYGFGINGTWKRFAVDINFQGASGYNIQNLFGSVIEPFQYDHTAYSYFLDRWHLADPKADPYDPNSKWIKGKYPPIIAGGNPNNALPSTWLLEPITYLRLKSLSISYSLKNIIKKVGIQDMFVSLSGQNLLTISNLREKTFDPEGSGNRYTYYPQIKTYNISFNVKF